LLPSVGGPLPVTREDPPHADDHRPTAAWDNLRRRAQLLIATREFFAERGFLEVQTPLLSADTVVDRHIEPIQVPTPDGQTRWLQTSPEFAMKRLLAAGAAAIYQICHAFRQGERGTWHNTEFTIVEWYRTGDDMPTGMRLLAELCQCLLGRAFVEEISYRDAFRRWTGVDPFVDSVVCLQETAEQREIAVPRSMDADDRDAWLDLLLTEIVQPRLAELGAVILYNYPPSQAALARVREEDPPVAERFELFVDGVELANGYHELTDPDELARRIDVANDQRRQDGQEPLPTESRLLAAMRAGLPPSTGVALGFDRLVMLAVGARRIDEVLPFPDERA